MTWQEIRPLTLGLVRRGEAFLVGDVPSGEDDPDLYRPVGGAVEFDERSDRALVPEGLAELVAPGEPESPGIHRVDGPA